MEYCWYRCKVTSRGSLKGSHLELYPVQVERHISLSSSREDVNTDSLVRVTGKKIQSPLTDQSMFKDHRLIGNRDDKPFSFKAVCFMFEV